jgi:hypothetical protein
VTYGNRKANKSEAMNNRFRGEKSGWRPIELSDAGIVKSMSFQLMASIAESSMLLGRSGRRVPRPDRVRM